MSVINVHDRKKFGIGITRIVFKKSVNEYTLPQEYSSFDFCCVGGGASGALPCFGSRYLYTRSYYNIAAQGGPGGFVISKKNINLPKNSKISVYIGNGGHINLPEIDEFGRTKVTSKTKKDRCYVYQTNERSYLRKFEGYSSYGYDFYKGIYFVYSNEGSGEKTYIKNLSNNEIICQADGAEPPMRHAYLPGSTFFYVWDVDSNSPGIYKGEELGSNDNRLRFPIKNDLYIILMRSIINNQNIPYYVKPLYYYYLHHCGGNPGGFPILGQNKGFTKGNFSYNIDYPNYYNSIEYNINYNFSLLLYPYIQSGSLAGVEFPSANEGAMVLTGTGKNKTPNMLHPKTPYQIIVKFYKPDGQNCFGLGPTTIMNESYEKGIAGGGSATNVYGENFPVGYESELVKGEDGGGDSCRIKIIQRPSEPKSIQVLDQATNGVPNTGGGGGGGIMFNYSGDNLGSSTQNVAKPGDGGSGVAFIDCFTNDYRPNIRVVNRYIYVQ